MKIYAMSAKGLVKAIEEKMSWSLRVYFSDYEIDFAKGIIYGIGDFGNPKLALQDFSFNEPDEYAKVKDTIYSAPITTKGLEWNPTFTG